MAAIALMTNERLLRRQAEQTGLLAYLADGPATLRELQELLAWSPDAVRDFVRHLVSAGLLDQYEEFYWWKRAHA